LQVFDPIRQGRAFGKSKSLAKLAGQKGAGEVTEALQSFVGDPSEPLLEELLTEAQWKKICSAGGLNDSCVPQVYAAIVRYRQQRSYPTISEVAATLQTCKNRAESRHDGAGSQRK
jgi:hypothetical protein